jgi:hypothetical protein
MFPLNLLRGNLSVTFGRILFEAGSGLWRAEGGRSGGCFLAIARSAIISAIFPTVFATIVSAVFSFFAIGLSAEDFQVGGLSGGKGDRL